MIRFILLCVCVMTAVCLADVPVAGLAKDLAAVTDAPVGWKLQSATEQRANDGELSTLQIAAESKWRVDQGRLIAEPAAGRFAVASYTVQAGGAGFYAIQDSLLRRSEKTDGRVELRVYVRRQDGRDETPAVYTCLDANELFDFDTFLGYLDAGDTIHVAVGPDGDAAGDQAEVDYTIVRTPAYPASTYGKSADWALLRSVPAGSVAGRINAWNSDEVPATLAIKPGGDRETIAAFRVPHSGYYALHDATATATVDVQATVYSGRSASPRRTAKVTANSTSLGCDVGYVAKGDVIYIAFTNAGSAEAQVKFAATIVEWSPRTPPLRVARGADGYLDVFEPANPLAAIDIPEPKWVVVPAQSGDASEAIRQAFEKAKSLQDGDGYAGVRLERGATYAVATDQVGGDLFALKDLRRIVFDGNGATLNVTSAEFPRKGIKLFHVSNCQQLVLGDFTLTATSVPFAVGEVTAVGPSEGGNQTITFRVDLNSLDPVADIARNGNASAYCYDPKIPGRLAVGTWTHYPGASSNGQPQIRATDEKGVFQHTVTRTNQSISVGAKWLVKNKGAGLAYLTTRSGTEDLTLWKVTGRASGGGLLHFWQTSRINILDCSFEPAGENWIGSSSDAVHGRGREGVWIENTIIRGICEDVMNTYATTSVVVPDDDPNDNVYSIRGLVRPSGEATQFRAPNPPGKESIAVGEKLVFFNPKTGHVLGHAVVRDINDGRFTLSTAIPGVDTWEPGDEKGSTTVYNTSAAARFVVRDSRFMDSMRFGIYIKAQGGVVFGNTFDGFSSPPVFVVNEPEWPEGPPGTHVWIQGNTFSQNNFGYMSRNRAFMVVDPADISIYTRHLRTPNSPTDFTGFITRGQYANSHVKIIGNTFHDWRGTAISVRNARNVRVEDNLFLPPVIDDVMRKTLARDPARSGKFAAMYFDSVDGAQVRGNRTAGLPEGDQPILRDQQVGHFLAADNTSGGAGDRGLDIHLTFSEWFGDRAEDSSGPARNPAELAGVTHIAGRLGAGLAFDGEKSRAVVRNSPDVRGKPATQMSLALWLRAEAPRDTPQTVFTQADGQRSLVIAGEKGRWTIRLSQDNAEARLDLGPVVPGVWQHVAVAFDGTSHKLRGYLDGIETAVAEKNVPSHLSPTKADTILGGGFRGTLDELHLFSRALTADEISALALRR